MNLVHSNVEFFGRITHIILVSKKNFPVREIELVSLPSMLYQPWYQPSSALTATSKLSDFSMKFFFFFFFLINVSLLIFQLKVIIARKLNLVPKRRYLQMARPQQRIKEETNFNKALSVELHTVDYPLIISFDIRLPSKQ